MYLKYESSVLDALAVTASLQVKINMQKVLKGNEGNSFHIAKEVRAESEKDPREMQHLTLVFQTLYWNLTPATQGKCKYTGLTFSLKVNHLLPYEWETLFLQAVKTGVSSIQCTIETIEEACTKHERYRLFLKNLVHFLL